MTANVESVPVGESGRRVFSPTLVKKVSEISIIVQNELYATGDD